ncbi:extracellular solute-binding protein [Myxococcota bacterium]|nr:extracellular solute-binding protein [Myxococcota bacterium]
MDTIKGWILPALGITVILGLIGVQTYLRHEATSGQQQRLVIWHSYIGNEADALKKLVAKFNATPAINKGFRLEMLFVSFSNLPDKLTNSLPRGQGPDIFIFGHDRLEDWIAKGLIAPVDYYMTPMELGDFSPKSTIDSLIRNKRLYALPLTAKTLGIYYRKLPNGEDVGARIEKLQQENRWTMEEFINLATSLTRKCPWRGSRCYGLGYQADDSYHHSPWLHAYGGEILSPAGEPSIVTAEGIAAASLAYRLAGNHDGAVVPPELSYPLMADMFKTGEIAMVISGPWFMSGLDAKEVPFGVTTFPTVKGNRANPYLTIEAVYMSSRTPNKEVAASAMRFLASMESSMLRAAEAGQMPIRISIKSQLLNNCKKATPQTDCIYRANFYDIFSRVAQHAVVMPASKEARIIWPPYAKALAAIVRRGVSPKSALKDAAWETDKYLGACLRRGK